MGRFACYSLLGLIALASLSGCGNRDSNREEVTGAVLLKGQPVIDGIINFAPLDGQQTSDGAQIVNGNYQIRKEKGLAPGKYKVSMYAGNGTSGAGNASPDSPNAGFKPGKERIPPEYNERSNVVREIVKGGPNRFDFDIP